MALRKHKWWTTRNHSWECRLGQLLRVLWARRCACFWRGEDLGQGCWPGRMRELPSWCPYILLLSEDRIKWTQNSRAGRDLRHCLAPFHCTVENCYLLSTTPQVNGRTKTRTQLTNSQACKLPLACRIHKQLFSFLCKALRLWLFFFQSFIHPIVLIQAMFRRKECWSCGFGKSSPIDKAIPIPKMNA